MHKKLIGEQGRNLFGGNALSLKYSVVVDANTSRPSELQSTDGRIGIGVGVGVGVGEKANSQKMSIPQQQVVVS